MILIPPELEIFIHSCPDVRPLLSPPGDPPQAAAWLGQCGIYLLIMVLEKGVISLVLLVPGWSKVRTPYGYFLLLSGPKAKMASCDVIIPPATSHALNLTENQVFSVFIVEEYSRNFFSHIETNFVVNKNA